jgi:hypothetical protein
MTNEISMLDEAGDRPNPEVDLRRTANRVMPPSSDSLSLIKIAALGLGPSGLGRLRVTLWRHRGPSAYPKVRPSNLDELRGTGTVDVVFRFARDSPLEGDGFELSVPPCDGWAVQDDGYQRRSRFSSWPARRM